MLVENIQVTWFITSYDGDRVQNLGNRMEKIQEAFNKDLEELKSKQTLMNNTINEIKYSLEGINSRVTEAEERISERIQESSGKLIEDYSPPKGIYI